MENLAPERMMMLMDYPKPQECTTIKSPQPETNQITEANNKKTRKIPVKAPPNTRKTIIGSLATMPSIAPI